MLISAIVAVAQNGVIGKDNSLPWHLSADLRHFKETTTGHTVILGRKNFESIGRPLPNRANIVLTRSADTAALRAAGCLVASSLESALQMAEQSGETECFVIGGAEVYRQALPLCQKLYLTQIHQDFEGDVKMPDLNMPNLGDGWQETERQDFAPDEKNPVPYSFLTLERQTL
jgi:dihydrofolate reductase